ncbi:hypothetical protein IPG41_03535 [Candidatus Peregrinibacteria bacterium]|nr:MAG: hypothetical protein IPG41_03535 [Candidatus Peregrinibacteria bacterium]
MINLFLTTLLYELVHFLTGHKDFFELGADAREEKMGHLKVPASFKHYLAKISGEHFIKDVKIVTSMLNGTPWAQLPLKGNAFFKALTEFFAATFATKVDELPGRFYLLSYDVRVLEIKKVIESDNRIADALREFLVTNSYQEVAGTLTELTQLVNGADTVLVQVPRDIDAELKKEIRKTLLEKHPHSFPTFQVNRGLIGGFRVFVNGVSTDHSWFSRISKLTSLKTVS